MYVTCHKSSYWQTRTYVLSTVQTLKCSVDVNVLEAQNDFFSRTKDRMTKKKTFVSNKSGNLLISTELKKKGNLCGTSISVWVRCERFQVSVEIKAKNEAKDVLDSSSSFRLKTPSTQAVKDRMIMLKTV